MKYKATKKLLKAISKGEFEHYGLKETKYYVRTCECLIDINKNWTMTMRIDEDAILNNSDFFEEIK